VAAAKARGVPVVSGRQMLTWLDGRNASSFEEISYAGDVLRFRVAVGAGATGLRAMVPATFAGKTLASLSRDGNAVSFTRETIKGVDYAMFAAGVGAYAATYEADTAAPVISAVSAAPAPDGTATVTWATDEPADSRVEYGTSPTALDQTASDGAAVTAHSIGLTGLTPGTTSHYRVRSADASGNPATSAVASFSVPVTAFPASTTIESGTLRGGAVSALTADDNVYYQVNSTTSGTRTSSWYGTFTGVPSGLSGLRVTYTGRNSRSCTQTIAIWRWSDSTWQQLNSGAVGNTETTRADLAPAGAASSYVSATGDLRVRVRCTTTANFFASGEVLRITYTRP
jgi:hypothetical protein